MPLDGYDHFAGLAGVTARWKAEAAAQHAAFPLGTRVRFAGPGTWDSRRGFTGRTGAVVAHNEFGGVYVLIDATARAQARRELVVRTQSLRIEAAGGEGCGGDVACDVVRAP